MATWLPEVPTNGHPNQKPKVRVDFPEAEQSCGWDSEDWDPIQLRDQGWARDGWRNWHKKIAKQKMEQKRFVVG